MVIPWEDGGVEVTLDGTGSHDPDGDNLDYSWSGGFDETWSYGPTPTVTFSYPSVYEVELTVSDEIWQSDQDTVVIAVSDWMTVEGRILNEFHSPRADQCVWVYDAEIRNRPELWRDLINGNVGTWGFCLLGLSRRVHHRATGWNGIRPVRQRLQSVSLRVGMVRQPRFYR